MKAFALLVYYRQLRVLRSPLFYIVSLLTLIFSLTWSIRNANPGSGMGLIYAVSNNFVLPGLLLLLTSAIMAGREEDEGSAEFVLASPLSSATIYFIKLCGNLPLTAAVLLLVFLPVGVTVAAGWLSTAAPLKFFFAELSIFFLWLLPSVLFTTALGTLLGVQRRGLRLYISVALGWFAISIVPVILHSVFYGSGWLINSPLWLFISWPATEMLIPSAPADLWSLLPKLPLLAWQRAFYLFLSFLMIAVAAALYRRRRLGVERLPRWLVGMLLFCGVLSLATGGGLYHTYRDIIGQARVEGRYYLELQREQPELFEIDLAEGQIHFTSYDLRLDISSPPRVEAEAAVEVINAGDERVTPLRLSLRHNFEVAQAFVGEQPWQFEQVGDRVVFPGLSLEAGEVLELTLHYAGEVEDWRITPYQPGVELHHFVKPYGLYLPPSYGWYPLPPALPVAVGAGENWQSVWDYTVYDRSFAVDDSLYNFFLQQLQSSVQPGESDFYSLYASLAGPVDAAFRVELLSLPPYSPVTNLPLKEAAAGQAVFEGTAPYIFLLGWPFQKLAIAGGELYLPYGDSLEHGAALAAGIHRMQDWFGESSETVKVVLFPYLQTSSLYSLTMLFDARAGFYLGQPPSPLVSSWWNRSWLFEATYAHGAIGFLSGQRRQLNSTELRLVEAYLEKERRSSGFADYPDSHYHLPYYSESLDGQLPSAVEIADWLEEYGTLVENPVHRLYQVVQERPLQPADLELFKKPPELLEEGH